MDKVQPDLTIAVVVSVLSYCLCNLFGLITVDSGFPLVGVILIAGIHIILTILWCCYPKDSVVEESKIQFYTKLFMDLLLYAFFLFVTCFGIFLILQVLSLVLGITYMIAPMILLPLLGFFPCATNFPPLYPCYIIITLSGIVLMLQKYLLVLGIAFILAPIILDPLVGVFCFAKFGDPNVNVRPLMDSLPTLNANASILFNKELLKDLLLHVFFGFMVVSNIFLMFESSSPLLSIRCVTACVFFLPLYGLSSSADADALPLFYLLHIPIAYTGMMLILYGLLVLLGIALLISPWIIEPVMFFGCAGCDGACLPVKALSVSEPDDSLLLSYAPPPPPVAPLSCEGDISVVMVVEDIVGDV